MIILDGIQLPAGLLWSDEFAASRVAQSVRRTLDGSVVVFEVLRPLMDCEVIRLQG